MEIDKITGVLKQWLQNVEAQIPVEGLYLFGSSIINEGYLFDDNTSDIDLVIVMPNSLKNAVERTNWLDILYHLKLDLELQFAKLLKRTKVSGPLCSLIPITSTELFYDIHKSGVEDFFRDNEFLDIRSNTKKNLVTPKSNDQSILSITKNLFEFSQSIRNKFLATSFIETKHALDWQSETDPVPKELVRTVATAAYVESKKLEEKTDIGVGLRELTSYVHIRRFEDQKYMNLANWFTKRILKKGEQYSLCKTDYLFISEIIFDMAISQLPIQSLTSDKNAITTAKPSEEINAIEVTFVLSRTGLINGLDENLVTEIFNAGVNLAWETPPYFEIRFEESDELKQLVKNNPKDGESIDRLRKLEQLKEKVEKGFLYIIYYQNHFFKNSFNIPADVLKAMQIYTLQCYANIFSFKGNTGIGGGLLEAYIFDYGELKKRHPIANVTGVVKFSLPDPDLEEFLNTNLFILKKDPNPDIMTLSNFHPYLSDIKTECLAQFFVPLLVQKLVGSGIDPLSKDQDIKEFVYEFTNLQNWYFGKV